jgi:hypothetical protein
MNETTFWIGALTAIVAVWFPFLAWRERRLKRRRAKRAPIKWTPARAALRWIAARRCDGYPSLDLPWDKEVERLLDVYDGTGPWHGGKQARRAVRREMRKLARNQAHAAWAEGRLSRAAQAVRAIPHE